MSQEETSSSQLRIAVLAGGDSAEREVSLESGSNAAFALHQRGHFVTVIDPAKSPLESISRNIDIILPMLHGTGAEDGVLQEQLNKTGIPWLGSSATASRLTFDKIATRDVLQAVGLPVAPGAAMHAEMKHAEILESSRLVGFPQVIKPSAQGSSVGISIIECEEELAEAVRRATHWGSAFLIEKYIAGREVTIPVIDDVAFPAVEILPSRPWFDYTAKYTDDATRYRVAPLDLSPEISEIVVRACRRCGVTAISRTDLRIDESGHCWILEINTIPGMTSHSLVPMSAQSLGISTGELCEQLLLKKLGRISATSWELSRHQRPQAA